MPRGATHCTLAVPAWGVLYIPRTVAPQAIGRIEVKFAPLRAEHEMKKARAEVLRKEI